MKSLMIEIDGKSVRGLVERIGGALWVHMNGRTFSFEPPKPAGRKGKGGPAAHGDMAAPMPGKINKVAVREGENVTVGQLIVVMEAMKMEYTLKAPVAGRVVSVRCAAGEQVSLGQALVKIEPDRNGESMKVDV